MGRPPARHLPHAAHVLGRAIGQCQILRAFEKLPKEPDPDSSGAGSRMNPEECSDSCMYRLALEVHSPRTLHERSHDLAVLDVDKGGDLGIRPRAVEEDVFEERREFRGRRLAGDAGRRSLDVGPLERSNPRGSGSSGHLFIMLKPRPGCFHSEGGDVLPERSRPEYVGTTDAGEGQWDDDPGLKY